MIWIDLEMTGLEPAINVIIEIATLVTDGDLNIIATGPELIIHQPQPQLDAMDAWNTDQHGKSGLTERVQSSTITNADAEAQTLAFIKVWVNEHQAPLCGNSIGQDRRFLRRYMAELDAYLHYRNVDVSSFKEMARRWYPNLERWPKHDCHRALDDIRNSVAELAYYRDNIFMTPQQIAPNSEAEAAQS
jgi:oligoribonuclease